MKTWTFLFVFALLVSGSALSAPPSKLIATDVLLSEDPQKPTQKGGSSTSVGGDSLDERRISAWFHGKEPVDVCYNYLESFGLTEPEVRKDLEASIANWKQYLKSKVLVRDGDMKSVNANLILRGKCKGDEDLVIHFGTGPIFGNIQDLKVAEGLHSPVAYANKTHLTSETLWSKGYIRIVPRAYYGADGFPDWRIKNSLRAVLAHELGHVFGFVHEPSTIMDGDVIQCALSKSSTPAIIDIDQEQELVTCVDCELRYRRPTAVLPKLFIDLGFNEKKELEIVRSKEGLAFVQGARVVKLAGATRTVIERRRVLRTSLPVQANTEKLVTLWQGALSGSVLTLIENAKLSEEPDAHLQLREISAGGTVTTLEFRRQGQ